MLLCLLYIKFLFTRTAKFTTMWIYVAKCNYVVEYYFSRNTTLNCVAYLTFCFFGKNNKKDSYIHIKNRGPNFLIYNGVIVSLQTE